MPIKRPQLADGEIYHIVVRGAGNSPVFSNNDDHYRVIFSLYEFNTTDPVEIREQGERRKSRGEPFSDTRKPLVEILAFCFMPNHIHLLVKQIRGGGISQFIRKFGAGYVGYFNKKHNRKGPLFAKFRAAHIKTNEQLKIVSTYIHTNPVSLIEPKWKERGVKDLKKVVKFLENYKWSSYIDYLGKNNFPSVTERSFLIEVMGGKKNCKNFIDDWVKYKKETRDFGDITP